MSNEALIVAGVRTPIGSLGGVLSTVPATELGAGCIKAALEKAGVPPDEVSEVIMGNVVGAGIKPSSLIAGATIKPKVQKLWLDWTDEADAESFTDFYGLQRRAGRLVQLEHERDDLLAGGRIEVAGGLVRKQQPGTRGKGARDRHALLLATR